MDNYMIIYRCREQHNITQHGGKFMDIKSYADVLRLAIKMQIGYEEEALQDCNPMREDYISGIITGLQIALDKIDASMFLAEK
jgi:hypothetical protein